MKIDPQDPRVVWRRAYRVGKVDALTGPLDITPAMFEGSLKGFELCRAAGVLPSIVFDHKAGTEVVGLGHVVGLEKRPDGWAWAGFYFEQPDAGVSPEYAAFAARIEAGFRAGTIADASIEARFDVKNVAYYGNWTCPMEINAIAILPPGDFPAIPGAGNVAAAGKSQNTIAFRASMVEAPDAEKEEERIVEEKLAALASRVEGVEKGIEECKSGIAKLVKAGEDAAKAAADARAEAEKTAAATASDETVKAARAKLDNRMVAGRAEKVDAALKSMDSPAAKLAVLTALDAVLPDKIEAGKDEKLDAKGADGAPAKAAADPGQAFIAAVQERDKCSFSAALVTACREKPELYGAEAEKKG